MNHRLLKNLLAGVGLDGDRPPATPEDWRRFLSAVDAALDEAEALKSSEELWRSLAQNLPDLICTTDLEGKITFSNRPIAGETRQQVIGRSFLHFMEESERDRVQSSLSMMLSRSQSISIEARARLTSVEPTWYSIRAVIVQSDDQPKGLILVCTDIGVRKALQIDTERFRLLLDQARENILVVDPEDFGRIVDVNRRTVKELGFTRGELANRRFVELVAAPVVHTEESWAAYLAAIENNGGRKVVQGLLKRKDGTVFPAEMFTSMVKVGDQTYLLVMALDVTERQRLESQLEQERARAVFSSKMATLGEMAGGVAHEINNPVTIIDGYAQQLSVWVDQEPFDKLRVKVQAKKISDTVLRIARIVRGLRSFSRDGTSDPLQRTELKTVIEDTLGLCAEKFRSNDIQLTIPTAQDMDHAIDSRPTEMSQVLLNLLMNAGDAVKRLPEKWVKLEVVDVADFVELSVTDSGAGIPAGIRERMMQPFFTTKDVGQGTGLGLSISRGIIEAHGGRLYYDEKSPHTRFVVVLPKHRAKLKTSA